MIRRALLVVVALVAGAAFIALAILVDRGRFAHFDQHTVSHWMPWLEPTEPRSVLARALLPTRRHTVGGQIAAIVVYPASVAISGALVLAGAALLWHRRRSRTAVLLVGAWVAANLIGLVGKNTVTRPRVHQTTYGHHGYLPGLSDSFPSGHTMRALVVAAVVAALWRYGFVAYLWALAAGVALVGLADHTVTDVAGGIAAGIALVALANAFADERR